MLGTRQTGMTPSGAHAWPSVSLLYITWHIVQKVVWRQCHPVQLNVSNVTYTGSSETHIHTLCYSWSFLPSRFSSLPQCNVVADSFSPQWPMSTQGADTRMRRKMGLFKPNTGTQTQRRRGRSCALPPSASQPTFTCKPAKQHSNIPKVVLVCLYSVWDALWKSELICGGSCEIPSYWSWGPRVPAAAF